MMCINKFVCSFLIFVGDITQKGYEKKRRKLLLPFMTGPNEPNNHRLDATAPPLPPHQSHLVTSTPKSQTSGEIEQSQYGIEPLNTPTQHGEGAISANDITNMDAEIDQRASSYIPISDDSLLVSSSEQPPTLENEIASPISTRCKHVEGVSSEAAVVEDEKPCKNHEDVTMVPAVPPHQNSPEKPEEPVSISEGTDFIPTASGSAQSPPELPRVSNEAYSNGNGAAVKPKGAKPRSRRRHKR